MSVNRDDATVPPNNAPLLPTYSITDNSPVHCLLSLPLRRSPSRSLFHPASQPRCWSPLSFLSSSCKPSHPSLPPSSLSLYLYFPSSSLSLLLSLLLRSPPPPPFLSFPPSFPLRVPLSRCSSFASILSFPPSLRYPPLCGPLATRRALSAAKRCTWDRDDKRNCANKYAPADNCSINRRWLVKRGRLNALSRSRTRPGYG